MDPVASVALPSAVAQERSRAQLLSLSVLVIATCGLIYELIAATLASYLLGDSVTQFSLVIGVYLSAMGLGSWLSRYIEQRLVDRFVQVQCVIAVVGGLSAPVVFLGFAHLASIRPLLFALLVIVGTMVGLEIPLMMRIMKEGETLRELVSRVLAFDYLGSLVASLTFPLLLLPYLGLVRTSLLFGTINACVALWCARAFRDRLRQPRILTAQAGGIAALLATALVFAGELESFGERQLFDAPVVLTKRTTYQRLTVTRSGDDWRLYIDGNLQFSSLDEHRYHEALVHPAFALVPDARRVLILGGGDGMALREVLRHSGVEHVDLVDLDPSMTEWFAEHPALVELNHGSLLDPRVTVHNADAMQWLDERRRADEPAYDLLFVDLPDPNNFSLGKLYTDRFYELSVTALRDGGIATVQSTSPYLSPHAYWCVVTTLESVALHPRPYHVHVPAFGDWGYVMYARDEFPQPAHLPAEVELRFLDDAVLSTLFVFPRDQQPPDVEPNRLDDQLLVHYYERDLRVLNAGPGPKPQ